MRDVNKRKLGMVVKYREECNYRDSRIQVEAVTIMGKEEGMAHMEERMGCVGKEREE